MDLGGAVCDMCLAHTGRAPRRPDMIVFKGGNDSSDSNRRFADTGIQAHAVWPTPDQTQMIVANHDDKKLSRISTDHEADQYELDAAALDP